MEKLKRVHQKFFMARELRLSIALIVIWSLLAGILFTYITKELGAKIEPGIVTFILVFVGYILIVVVLAMFFAHRFIGPFERLKMEIKLVLAGNYQRRLNVRGSDDFYIRSFIMEVNKIIDILDNKCRAFDQEKLSRVVDSGLLNMIALIEKPDFSKEKLREALILLHQKLHSMLEGSEKRP
jgi:nitrogen fixation/metabolism regulation signal transduction histidine kinase